MSKNIDILNFLNLINEKLGKSYLAFGKSPLPENFELTEEAIKERIVLSQICEKTKLPKFAYAGKKEVKKNIKNSIKNCKKMLKNRIFDDFSPLFSEKFENYLKIRLVLSKIILKDFKQIDFSETEAIRQIYALDPVLTELLEMMFYDEDVELSLDGIEEKYMIEVVQKAKQEKVQTKKAARKVVEDMAVAGGQRQLAEVEKVEAPHPIIKKATRSARQKTVKKSNIGAREI